MSYIFRQHNEGDNTLADWENTSKYGSDVISQIQDPNGESAKREITSIPSPFARIDLVKTAFKKVVDAGIDGNSIHHKMVSDCFDLGQIFFEFDKHKNKFEILVWDKTDDLQKLLDSPHFEHRQLGDTYATFLKQDGNVYNFDKMQQMYFLNFKEGPSELNIIGATSPATFFFTSANKLHYVSEAIRFGNKKPFDDNYQPLYRRDIEYQKYWYVLRKFISNFARLFPEVDAYLAGNLRLLNQQDRNTVNAVRADDIKNYADVTIGGAGHTAYIIDDIAVKQQLIKLGNITQTSGFVIRSSKAIDGVLPLVLPVDTYTHKTVYTKDFWDKDTKVPYCNPTPVEKRTLPNDGSQYPYLTIGDFFTDTVIRMPYRLNRDSFYDGACNSEEDSYLLPLKNTFFRYFTVDDLLTKEMPDRKKLFELQKTVSGVTAVLRIPVANGYIEYRRIYFETNKPDVEHNDGALVDRDFAIALFPNIKFRTDREAYYRIGFISGYNSREDYELSFHTDVGESQKSTVITRNTGNSKYKKCDNHVLENVNFDYIKLRYGEHEGIAVPRFKKQEGTEQFTFAIDFGTSNTHVEYKAGSQAAKPLDITAPERQIHLLATDYEREDRFIFDFDFLPEKVGQDVEFKFPMRTALSESKNFNWGSDGIAIGHANLAFPYEKRNVFEYNSIRTGLKWSNEEYNVKKVQCYIESLFLILRNKVISGNGDLSKTKIIWFYPISMTENRYGKFADAWKKAYAKYFIDFDKNDPEFNGDEGRYNEKVNEALKSNLIPATESVAPYLYYKSKEGNISNVTSIDIGGGTSDIAIVVRGQVKNITSFRFAANSIFGDGYATNGVNEIVRAFKGKISETLKSAKLDSLYNICEDLHANSNSSDVASFLFSLATNKEVLEKGIPNSVDFLQMLQRDEKHKLIFLIFYVAIIYHLAHIMKAKEFAMPRHITFSGNGSKVIQVLTTDNRLLENFTKLIFEKIYGTPYPGDGLTILLNPTNPKEATCKGGIAQPVAQYYDMVEKVKCVMKSDRQTFVKKEDTYAKVLNNRTEYLGETTKEVKEFIDFLFNLNSEFSFKNKFGVSGESITIAKEECFRDLEIFTENGLKQKLAEVSKEDTVEESLFFYPLHGMLNALARAIAEKYDTVKEDIFATQGFKEDDLFASGE
jgi:hypothetical protein